MYYSDYPDCNADQETMLDCFYGRLLPSRRALIPKCANTEKLVSGPCPGHCSRKAKGIKHQTGIVFDCV